MRTVPMPHGGFGELALQAGAKVIIVNRQAARSTPKRTSFCAAPRRSCCRSCRVSTSANASDSLSGSTGPRGGISPGGDTPNHSRWRVPTSTCSSGERSRREYQALFERADLAFRGSQPLATGFEALQAHRPEMHASESSSGSLYG
jgi:hypothetical protein